MERFVIIVNGWKPLTIITKRSILDVAAVLDPPLSVLQGSFLGPLLFLIYVNDMSQVVNSNMFLYVDNSCLMFQHEHVEEIEKVLDNPFGNICDWFLYKKLSIHFGEDKTKSILSTVQHKIKNIRNLI